MKKRGGIVVPVQVLPSKQPKTLRFKVPVEAAPEARPRRITVRVEEPPIRLLRIRAKVIKSTSKPKDRKRR